MIKKTKKRYLFVLLLILFGCTAILFGGEIRHSTKPDRRPVAQEIDIDKADAAEKKMRNTIEHLLTEATREELNETIESFYDKRILAPWVPKESTYQFVETLETALQEKSQDKDLDPEMRANILQKGVLLETAMTREYTYGEMKAEKEEAGMYKGEFYCFEYKSNMIFSGTIGKNTTIGWEKYRVYPVRECTDDSREETLWKLSDAAGQAFLKARTTDERMRALEINDCYYTAGCLQAFVVIVDNINGPETFVQLYASEYSKGLIAEYNKAMKEYGMNKQISYEEFIRDPSSAEGKLKTLYEKMYGENKDEGESFYAIRNEYIENHVDD